MRNCSTTSRDFVDEEKLSVDNNDQPEQGTYRITWDGPNDPTNPRNFTAARKWTITSAAFLATILIPMNGTSITAATAQISQDFNISNDPFPNIYWTVFSWTLGGAAFVIVGMSVMEDVGVRKSFVVLYVFFILMIVPQVSSRTHNPQTFC